MSAVRTRVLIVSAFALFVAASGRGEFRAEEEPAAGAAVRVYAHPVPLKASDELRDGETGRRIELKAPTMLFWVDRMPDARFEHSAEYVLVSAEGTRVVQGGWWPVLSGEALFRTDKVENVAFPVTVERGAGDVRRGR